MANPALGRQFGSTGSAATIDAASSARAIPAGFGEDRMTIGGTAADTGLMLVLLVIAGAWGWAVSSPTGALPLWSIGVLLVAFVLAIVTIFNPKIAIITTPIYTAAQGVFLGAMSKAYENAWGGIVITAVLATVAVFVVMLVLFVTRAIAVTNKLRSVIIGATLGIALFYFASFLLALFGVQMPFVWEGGDRRHPLQRVRRRDSGAESPSRLRLDRAGCRDGCAEVHELVRRVRPHDHDHLALHGDPAAARQGAKLEIQPPGPGRITARPARGTEPPERRGSPRTRRRDDGAGPLRVDRRRAGRLPSRCTRSRDAMPARRSPPASRTRHR